MLTLEVKLSWRLLLLYSLLYGLTIVGLLLCATAILWYLAALLIVMAAVVSILSLVKIKKLLFYNDGTVQLQYRAIWPLTTTTANYESVVVYYRGIYLIILQLINKNYKQYLVCLFDSFSSDDFASLQRHLYLRQNLT